jgi:hypothetical protein
LDKNVIIAIALAVIGVAMIVAGITTLRSDVEPKEEASTTKRSKKAVAPEKESNMLANWLFGGHRGMEAKKEASLRIKIGIFFVVVAAFIGLAIYLQQ